MIDFNTFKEAELAKDPVLKAEYDSLNEEFKLIGTLISMRKKAGLTQEQVAQKMKTKKPNISRLESGKSNPSLKTLLNYADACGFKLDLSYRHV
ncbi:TPA: helix-turn-helix domain-containing protein [Photobacterium damselae]